MAGRDTTTTPASSGNSARPAVWVKDLGLTVLYEPQDEPIADVVFVHGLQGNPRKTWLYEGPVEDPQEAQVPKRRRLFGRAETPTISVFWPADILPNDHSNVRILTFGYDSKVTNLGGLVNKNNIFQHGRALRSAVLTDRKRLERLDRPLIFVAHSLGGLLVKEALLESLRRRDRESEYDLSSLCSGIIFFGTPHRGANDAYWGQILSNIVGAIQVDTNSSILRDLEPSSGSSKLEELRLNFMDILDDGHIKIYSFQESAGKTGIKLAGGKVVPDESSSFDSRRFEEVDTINANHMNMCRFRSKDDDGYIKFVGALAGCLKTIQQKSREIEAKKLEAEKAKEKERRKGLYILTWPWLGSRTGT